MTLPILINEKEELEKADAFLSWLNEHAGDQQELLPREMLARYWHIRTNRPELLADQIRKQKPEADNRLQKARQIFDSDKCPACFKEKRKGKDFVCTPCWRSLPKELKEPLIPGWKDGNNVENFFRVVNWLRYEASKPVVCR